MILENPQTTLNALYEARMNLLLGKVQSYAIGDRNFTLLNLNDLNKAITAFESIVIASTGSIIVSDLRCTGENSTVQGRE